MDAGLGGINVTLARKATVTLRHWFPVEQRWFRWGLAAHLVTLLLLAHAYDMAVFRDVSERLLRGEGIYAPFSSWLQRHGDGYYAYPPLYAYLLWVSGWVASLFGSSHWWVHHLLIKAWMVLADLVVFAFLRHLNPDAAKTYWRLWFVPVAAIALVQPDLWVGFLVLLAFHFARQERWQAVGLALAAGIGLKIVPLVIVPFLILELLRRRQWTAVGKLTGALVVGLVVVWLPYAVLFGDAIQFMQVIEYHLSRPPSGLTAAAGARILIDVSWAVQALVAPEPLGPAAFAITDQQLDTFYRVITPLALILLGSAALMRRLSLAQTFTLPLLAFLLVNRVVNEQHLLQVLPLLLLTNPSAIARLTLPYSIYLLAAGTPLRLFPQEYGLPLSLEALLPEALRQGAALPIGLVLAIATGGAALLFSYRIAQLIREAWGAEGAADIPGALLRPERVRT